MKIRSADVAICMMRMETKYTARTHNTTLRCKRGSFVFIYKFREWLQQTKVWSSNPV